MRAHNDNTFEWIKRLCSFTDPDMKLEELLVSCPTQAAPGAVPGLLAAFQGGKSHMAFDWRAHE